MIELVKRFFRDSEVPKDAFGRDKRLSVNEHRDLISYFFLFAFGTVFPPFGWGYLLFSRRDSQKWKSLDMFDDEKKANLVDKIVVLFTTFISCPIFYFFIR